MGLELHPSWIKSIKRFESPSLSKAYFQILNTLIPFLGIWFLSVYTVKAGWSYFITLPLLALGGLFLIRIFIFFHDCTHGSFFKNPKLNAFWGTLFGILTYTPYDDWRQSHGIHHNTNGNLDLRGVGDVWTLTLAEYRSKTPFMRFVYRFYRNPLILFLLIPPLLFFLLHRVPHALKQFRPVMSVVINNVGLAILLTAMVWWGGWEIVLLVHLPMFYFSAVAGVWLFYVQHQFDPGYWERTERWNSVSASMDGSSHYKLPKIMQWFSGNIGLHHIHHIRPRIPNYQLQNCYDSTPELQLPHPLRFFSSFRSINLNLWDEKNKRLLSFREAKKT